MYLYPQYIYMIYIIYMYTSYYLHYNGFKLNSLLAYSQQGLPS